MFSFLRTNTLSGTFGFSVHDQYIIRIGQKYTGCETTLSLLPQPQLQTSQEIYAYSIKILLMLDSVAKFQEPELIFNAYNVVWPGM